jgi:hypothetical protein
VLPIAIEAALLASFAIGLEFTDQSDRASGMTVFWLTGVASMAMGLQNATITRISSGVVRTTHVTGVLTDLGLESMQFLLWVLDRRKDSPPNPVVALVRSVRVHPTTKRLALLVSIVGSFALGAGLGAVAHNSVERWAMFPPVVFLLWLIFRDVAIPIAEIEPSALVGGAGGLDLPPSIAIFHVRQDLDRRRRMHQLPDLQAWADRLPVTARIVVLDMGEKSNFDTSAVLELRAVLAKFGRDARVRFARLLLGFGGCRFRCTRSEGFHELHVEPLVLLGQIAQPFLALGVRIGLFESHGDEPSVAQRLALGQ